MAKAKVTEEEKVVAEEVIAEQEAQKELTEEETKAAEDAYLKELVPFYAFKDNDKYKDDIMVGVNGKMFQIQRGEEVMIPRYVRNVIEQSMAQDANTAKLIERQSSEFAAEARSRNV